MEIKLDSYLRSYTEVNSGWIKGLRVIHKTIKLKEENMGDYLCDFRMRKDF